jgi:hypothetical protein
MELSHCPKCNADMDGGSIYETCIQQRENYEYWQDKTDAEIRQIVEEHYRPPYRWSRWIGIEIQGEYDGVSYYRCPDCDSVFDRFTGKEVV